MKEKHSEKVETWPEVGCGARFVPWARGASMVMEVQMTDGFQKSWMTSLRRSMRNPTLHPRIWSQRH
eukprot:10963058-Prorocentrum_lima.AAC.1